MPSKHGASPSNLHADLIRIVERLRDEGYTFSGQTDKIVSVAIRRWRSFEGRYPKLKAPTKSDRIHDLVKGLQSRFEPSGIYVRAEEWQGLGEELAAALSKAG